MVARHGQMIARRETDKHKQNANHIKMIKVSGDNALPEDVNPVLLEKQLEAFGKRQGTSEVRCRKMPPEYLKLIRGTDWDGVCHVYFGESPTCRCGTTTRPT